MKKFSEEIKEDLPFVIYKEPHSSLLHIIQQRDSSLNKDDSLEKEGFYFYPFDIANSQAVVFPIEKIEKKTCRYKDFDFESYPTKLARNKSVERQKTHIKKVKKAIEKIKSSPSLKKVIISSKFPIEKFSFSWQNALLNLMETYDESMVWVWFHPKIGMWMGATPELLGSYKEGKFETMALAGTLPVNPGEPLIWSGKEVQEQKLVTDFIVNQLEKYSDNLEVFPPATVYQGKIAHIQSIIKAKMSQNIANKMALKLHPTPAVSGLPVEEAKNLIKSIEEAEREYYTGFLGMKEKDKYTFYVNLRTMKIEDKQLILFAGGGILANSNPQKEWEEIENKTDVIYNIINK